MKSLMTPGQESGGILPANHLRVFKISDGDALAQLFLAIENFGEETGDLYFLKSNSMISFFQILFLKFSSN